MEAEVQESPYLFVNIYAPNKTQDQCRFFDKLNNNIEDCVANKELKKILGIDFNVTFASDLDCSGGRPFTKDYHKCTKSMLWFWLSGHLADRKPWKEAIYMETKKAFLFKEDFIIG